MSNQQAHRRSSTSNPLSKFGKLKVTVPLPPRLLIKGDYYSMGGTVRRNMIVRVLCISVQWANADVHVGWVQLALFWSSVSQTRASRLLIARGASPPPKGFIARTPLTPPPPGMAQRCSRPHISEKEKITLGISI